MSSLGNITFRLTPRVSYTHVSGFSLKGLTAPFLLYPTHINYISLYALNRKSFIGRRPKYELTTHSSTLMMDDNTHAHTPNMLMSMCICNIFNANIYIYIYIYIYKHDFFTPNSMLFFFPIITHKMAQISDPYKTWHILVSSQFVTKLL